MSTFVVRFWQESSAGAVRLHGRIVYVPSGESAMFLTVDGMLDFLDRFGVGTNDTSLRGHTKNS
jgi:hypothetical protein